MIRPRRVLSKPIKQEMIDACQKPKCQHGKEQAHMTVTIKIGDCRDVLVTIPDQSVHCIVTSPPYFGLRDYGVDGQMGLEPTPTEFVEALVGVLREARRVLRDDGTLWLNLGDSYSRSPAKGGSGPGGKNEDRWGYGTAQGAKVGSSDGAVGRADRPGSRSGGLGEKQLLGIPWRVAFALQADGWYLRQDIIWHKPNPMPESVMDRCTKAHEYVFLLSKSPRYHYDAEAISEEATGQAPGNKVPTKGGRNYADGAAEHRTAANLHNIGARDTRNKRSVWSIATQPYTEAHFATMAPELAETCIKAGCPVGGTVLDPFGGAGTTGLVADQLQRNAVLIELNPKYADIAHQRILLSAGMFSEVKVSA